MKTLYVCLNDFSLEASSMLKRKFKIVVREESTRPSESELCNLVDQYDCLIIGAKEKMTEAVFQNVKKKNLTIATLSIGLDHISKSFFEDKRIHIISCIDSNVVSVAEHTFALILSLSKKILIANQCIINNQGRAGLNGLPNDIYQKYIGVIGAGRIGQKIIEMANCFNMNILCYTPNPKKHKDLLKKKIEFVSLDCLLSKSDIITLHIPFTPDTLNILNSENLPLIKKTAILVNTSRSGLIDNSFLSQLVRENRIFGVGLDIDNEEREIINYYTDFKNVIITPHIAGVTNDSINRMDIEIAEKLLKSDY